MVVFMCCHCFLNSMQQEGMSLLQKGLNPSASPYRERGHFFQQANAILSLILTYISELKVIG